MKISPKWIGSTPYWIAIGASSGATIMIADTRLTKSEAVAGGAVNVDDPDLFVTERDACPDELVTRVANNPDFGGTWTYVLEPADGGTQLRLTEDGEVHGNMMRFFAHYLFGYDATARLHLDDLERETEGGAPAETDAPAGG